MLPPNSVPLTRLAKEEGIALGTLIRWRDDARRQGQLLPAADRGPDNWSSRDKFAAVLETATLNETDMAAYCRQRGLLPLAGKHVVKFHWMDLGILHEKTMKMEPMLASWSTTTWRAICCPLKLPRRESSLSIST
jgi:hypothetical protein